MSSAQEHATAECLALCEAVDPADGVRPVRGALAQAIEHRVESADRRRLQNVPRALEGPEPKRAPHDQPRQAHPADGGEEQLSVLVGTADDQGAVGRTKPKLLHESSEGAVAMMVLAVDVGRDT